MEKTVDYLSQHPLFFIIAVIISVMILFSSLKKIVEMALLIAALVVLYAAYLSMTGGHVSELFRTLEQSFTSWLHTLGEIFTWLLNLLKFSKKEML